QEEVRDQVGIAPLPLRQPPDQVLAVGLAQVTGDLRPAHERRVPHDGVEAAAGEDLRELQRPVEGRPRAQQLPHPLLHDSPPPPSAGRPVWPRRRGAGGGRTPSPPPRAPPATTRSAPSRGGSVCSQARPSCRSCSSTSATSRTTRSAISRRSCWALPTASRKDS